MGNLLHFHNGTYPSLTVWCHTGLRSCRNYYPPFCDAWNSTGYALYYQFAGPSANPRSKSRIRCRTSPHRGPGSNYGWPNG